MEHEMKLEQLRTFSKFLTGDNEVLVSVTDEHGDSRLCEVTAAADLGADGALLLHARVIVGATAPPGCGDE
jgi:hypothetical protein